MVARLFAVIRSRGAGWKQALAVEEQVGWLSHAVFMDGLQAEGFVLLGGPLEGTSDYLLVFRAQDGAEIESRLAADPWSGNVLLHPPKVTPWTLRLGSLD